MRDADVIVSTSTGAADPRVLAACGYSGKDDENNKQSSMDSTGRTMAPDQGMPLSFPFVIVDEACQSVEPASLVPIVASNSCRSLVMLGDPCQLPPTVKSEDAKGLSLSLMERLAEALPALQVTAPVDNCVKDTSFLDALPVKQARSLMRAMENQERQSASYRKRFTGSILLSIQYRMHPSIAALPSAIFYDGLLSTPDFMKDIRRFPPSLNKVMPCGDRRACVRLIDVGGRCHERQGMHSRFGKKVYSTSSIFTEEQTSYWNEPEATRVISLLKDVLKTNEDGEVKSIGVISPYNGQVQLIRSLVADDSEITDAVKASGTMIEVKSVDGYQGRERDVIIFSAVRSNRHGSIGFLKDWRRMNVALTRAKSALIVVGDFDTLTEFDKHWAALYKWATVSRVVVDDYDSPDDEPSI
jgi:superfamily I DNA and/or RNA helicase